MIYCVDIIDYKTGDFITTILETDNYTKAYATANNWNNSHGVTIYDIESFYNEDILIHPDGHICRQFAEVYHDDTR